MCQNHADHRLAKKYLSSNASGILTFGQKCALGTAREAGALPRCAAVVHAARPLVIEHIGDLLRNLDQTLAAVRFRQAGAARASRPRAMRDGGPRSFAAIEPALFVRTPARDKARGGVSDEP